MYYIPDLRDTYEQRHKGNLIQVSISDVCFSVHALLLTIITWGQVIYYDGHHQIPSECAFMTGFFFFVACAVYILFITQGLDANKDPWNWFTFIYFIAMTKLAATFVKYPPQIAANYRLKSTIGFSVSQLLLDMTGSVLSLLQLVLDCYFSGEDWSGIWGNPVKVGLSCISLTYDAILLYQHYYLYPSRMMVPPPEFSSSLSAANSLAMGTVSHGPDTTYYTTIQNAIENNEDDGLEGGYSGESNVEMQRREIGSDRQRLANWNSNSSQVSMSMSSQHSKYNFSLPKNLRPPKPQTDRQHQRLADNDDEFDEIY